MDHLRSWDRPYNPRLPVNSVVSSQCRHRFILRVSDLSVSLCDRGRREDRRSETVTEGTRVRVVFCRLLPWTFTSEGGVGVKRWVSSRPFPKSYLDFRYTGFHLCRRLGREDLSTMGIYRFFRVCTEYKPNDRCGAKYSLVKHLRVGNRKNRVILQVTLCLLQRKVKSIRRRGEVRSSLEVDSILLLLSQ